MTKMHSKLGNRTAKRQSNFDNPKLQRRHNNKISKHTHTHTHTKRNILESIMDVVTVGSTIRRNRRRTSERKKNVKKRIIKNVLKKKKEKEGAGVEGKVGQAATKGDQSGDQLAKFEPSDGGVGSVATRRGRRCRPALDPPAGRRPDGPESAQVRRLRRATRYQIFLFFFFLLFCSYSFSLSFFFHTSTVRPSRSFSVSFLFSIHSLVVCVCSFFSFLEATLPSRERKSNENGGAGRRRS